jgi:hypothetical protein
MYYRTALKLQIPNPYVFHYIYLAIMVGLTYSGLWHCVASYIFVKVSEETAVCVFSVEKSLLVWKDRQQFPP